MMIQAGLEYSYVTNGVARVLLRITYDDPRTLKAEWWLFSIAMRPSALTD
jgi:hypothetical protein